MSAIQTPLTAIDRKLHKVVLDSDSSFSSMMELATAVRKEKYREFSYLRDGKIEYSSPGAIQSYVSYARAINLLDGELASARPKQDIRGLESFQQWLGNSVLEYLASKGCDPSKIGDAIQRLLSLSPPELPTQEKVRSQFSDPPSALFFRFSLKTGGLTEARSSPSEVP